MRKKITRNGNSACLILGADLLGFLGASVGDYVDVEFSDGRLLVGSFSSSEVAKRKRAARKRAPKGADVDGMVAVVGLYRKYCVPAGMPDIRSTPSGMPSSASLSTALKARWGQCEDLDWWERYFRAVSGKGFFCGENERGWRASLKWLCGRSKFEEWQDVLINGDMPKPKSKGKSIDYSYSVEDEWQNPSH